MISLFRKPKVIFECLIPGVAEIMPIVPAKDIRHAWVNRAVAEVKADRQHPEFGMHKKFHTAKCPGIFNLQRNGWVVRTWQDITIETFGDGERFEWTSAIDQSKLGEGIEGYVSYHSKEQLHKYMDNWPNNTLRPIIKIHSPWICKVPKGYYLLEMPVAYSDENRFTVAPGFFNPELGRAPLNVQLLWHVMKGKTLIKAGTPIAQYVLIPKDKVDMEIVTHKDTEHKNIHTLLLNNRFITSYGDIKRFYGEEK